MRHDLCYQRLPIMLSETSRETVHKIDSADLRPIWDGGKACGSCGINRRKWRYASLQDLLGLDKASECSKATLD